MFALSIRQPWAWLIIRPDLTGTARETYPHFKDIENRVWYTNFRGKFLVHAAKGMTQSEYDNAQEWALTIDPQIPFPSPNALQKGGIVGEVELTACLDESPSPWFCGPYGYALKNPKPLPFLPLLGQLKFFHVPNEIFL
jgi:hypothetical protein